MVAMAFGRERQAGRNIARDCRFEVQCDIEDVRMAVAEAVECEILRICERSRILGLAARASRDLPRYFLIREEVSTANDFGNFASRFARALAGQRS